MGEIYMNGGNTLSLRNDALKSKAFLKLKDAYENREKFIAESGKKAVWMLGADCPEDAIKYQLNRNIRPNSPLMHKAKQ